MQVQVQGTSNKSLLHAGENLKDIRKGFPVKRSLLWKYQLFLSLFAGEYHNTDTGSDNYEQNNDHGNLTGRNSAVGVVGSGAASPPP